jgi:hypothetical protein
LEEAVNLSSDITDGDDVIANNLPEMWNVLQNSSYSSSNARRI